MAGCNETNETVVYQSHFTPTTKIYRIPSLISTSQGTLLAFAEQRYSYFDHGKKNIVLKRSFDSSITWSEIVILTEHSSAYSDMALVENNVVGVLFEYWETLIPYWSIIFKRIDTNDIPNEPPG